MKKFLSCLLALTLLGTPLNASAAYEVPEWATSFYENLDQNSTVPDTSMDILEKNASLPISRGNFAGFLAEVINSVIPQSVQDAYPAVALNYFADNTIFSNSMLKAASYGIIAGSVGSDGLRYANPNDNLNREQASAMICSALDFFERVCAPIEAANAPASYQDQSSISPWAIPYTDRIAKFGLMVGDEKGNFNPQSTLNHMQATVILSGCLNRMSEAYAKLESNTDGSYLVLDSKIDWSSANKFGSGDYSVAKPKTGTAMGYYTTTDTNGIITGIHFPQPVQQYDWNTGSWSTTAPEEFYVERYDNNGNVIFSKTLPMELPVFGSFLNGDTCYYVAYGQENLDNIDDQEVWRIVKYDQDWNKIGQVSATGGETYTAIPFRSTIARMDLSEDKTSLVLYAARQRYDGHQSNITFFVDTNSMTFSAILGEEFPINHVSHSFGQFVRFDGDYIVTVDHGDAYPRSLFMQLGTMNSMVGELDLLPIYGKTGENVTNAIGSGLETTSSGYLFLGCSDSQQGLNDPWNLFLVYVPRQGQGTFTWLTDSTTDINCARLVKMNEDQLVVMWAAEDGLHTLNVSGNGTFGSEYVYPGVPMPPTEPVVRNDKICWIQTNDGQSVLYQIPINP